MRLPVGFAQDPRLALVSRRASVPVADVFSIWVSLLCHAAEREERGTVEEWFWECAVLVLDIPEPTIASIRAAMSGLLIDGAKVKGWHRYSTAGEWQIDVDLDTWRSVREAIFSRDGFRCRYCGTRGGRLECDHVIPLSRGGVTEEDNLVTACIHCNRRKGKRTPEEAGMTARMESARDE